MSEIIHGQTVSIAYSDFEKLCADQIELTALKERLKSAEITMQCTCWSEDGQCRVCNYREKYKGKV